MRSYWSTIVSQLDLSIYVQNFLNQNFRRCYYFPRWYDFNWFTRNFDLVPTVTWCYSAFFQRLGRVYAMFMKTQQHSTTCDCRRNTLPHKIYIVHNKINFAHKSRQLFSDNPPYELTIYQKGVLINGQYYMIQKHYLPSICRYQVSPLVPYLD